MDSAICKILKKIESNGFEAYVVGGFVRDFILGIDSTDVDICTNALPKDIINIFNVKNNSNNYGSIKIISKKYNFDITTYRRESHYNNRKPEEVVYINNLLEDLQRRDFTINTLCMNSNGEIIDILNGKDDIKHKRIKIIGDVSEKLTEDPLRILRAIRFMTTLDFELDDEIEAFIKNNGELVTTLSFNRKKEELEKILSSKNVLKGLNFLKKYNLLEHLNIKYDKIVIVQDVLGMWAQIEFDSRYQFNKSSLKIINNVRNILKNNYLDNDILFSYDLYTLLVAGQIMGLSVENINEMYNKLPIKSIKDINISVQEIIDVLQLTNNNMLKDIINDLKKSILTNKVENSYEEIKKYLIEKWK